MSEEETDMLAAEYVLGTLGGDERARVQAEASRDGGLRAAIERWQRAFAPLISAGPVPVPAHVWTQIEAQL